MLGNDDTDEDADDYDDDDDDDVVDGARASSSIRHILVEVKR